MKTYWNLFFILFTLNSGMVAQNSFQVTREITVNVSASELWQLVGPGFVEVYKWSSNVDHAVGQGQSPFQGAVCDERFCDLNVQGFSKISEKLSNYDEQQMNLRYVVQNGMPGFVEKAENDWTVVPIDANRSKLVMKANFAVKGLMGFFMKGMMEKKMVQTLETVLNDAKVYAETGEISAAKAARIAELEKKQKKAA